MSKDCCDFQISENRLCGSYAFNLWQEGIEQKYCDRHHWQAEATRLRVEVEGQRRAAAKLIFDALTDERDALKAEVEALRAGYAT